MNWTFSGTPEPSRRVTDHGALEVSIVTTKRYTSGVRTFELLLSGRVLKGKDLWTVERAMDVSWACSVVIPGMQVVAESTPDAAFARACDCIDKWLWRSR